jgi:type I restriction enzyme S subunit
MTFPRYPEYKDSGVEWLGGVPGHWRIDRLKRSTTSSKNGVWGDEAKQDVNDIPCVRVADFDRQGLRVQLVEPTIRNIVDSERVGRVLVQGDLLLEKSGGGEGQPVGCVVLYDDPLPAVCSNFVARVQTAPGMESSFWRYVHAAAYAVRLNTRSIKQTSGIQNLDASQYFDERAGFPPLPEQTQITAFLDRETAKIDALVAEQRRLMALLKEKRQAVISHAVTRGLNPDAPLKPSGIEWLGDVPEHWEVSAIKRYTDKITDGAHVSPETDNGVFHFVSTKDVGADSIDFENCLRTSEQSYESMVKTGCRPMLGDVLFSKDGTIGRTVVIREERDFVVASSLIIIRPTASVLDSDFLNCLCQSQGIANQVDCFVKGAGLPRLSIQNLTKVVGCFPPIGEQKVIAEFLGSELTKFDTLTTEAQRAIDLLQERRTALISAAVTGQIDVRGAV